MRIGQLSQHYWHTTRRLNWGRLHGFGDTNANDSNRLHILNIDYKQLSMQRRLPGWASQQTPS